jgi:hypothetical protein
MTSDKEKVYVPDMNNSISILLNADPRNIKIDYSKNE